MSAGHMHDRPFPRGMLIGAAVLIAFTITFAAISRHEGVDTFEPTAAVVASRDLRFEDRTGGTVAVIDAGDGKLLDTVEYGAGGFLRATLRGFARERRAQEAGPVTPFRLTQWADGRLTLEDPITGRRVDLQAFGPTNVQAFARLLTARSATP